MNEKHMDEKIIELRNKMHTPRKVEYTIKNETYVFEEKSIFENRAVLLLPKDFKEMPEEIAKLKYPFENRPKLIYTNDSTSINVAFNCMNIKLDDSEVEMFKNQMINLVKKMKPSSKWLDEGMKRINKKNVGYYEFITGSIDVNIYNLIFFTNMDEQSLLCTFNCTEDEMQDWRPIAKDVMYSLVVCGK